MSNKINTGSWVIFAMILTAGLSRLLPHPPNFTPVGGMALFAAAYFKRRELALIMPLLAMFVSDLVLNNLIYARLYPEYYKGFQWFGVPSVYASFLIIGILGLWWLQKVNGLRLVTGSLMASVLFFLITNAGTWASAFSPYPKNFAGLQAAYIAGWPFFMNTLAGDLFYTMLLFGTYAWVKKYQPRWVAA